MNEAKERNDKETMEWVAGQTFESLADIVTLDGMPSNDDMAERGINLAIWMRTVAIILQDDDKQLYAKFKDDETADFWLDWMEHLWGVIETQKAGLDMLEACHTRLLVCAHRYAEKNFPEGDGG